MLWPLRQKKSNFFAKYSRLTRKKPNNFALNLINSNITITIYAVEEPNDSNVVVGDEGFRLVNSGERLGCGASLLLQPGDDCVGCAAWQQ